MKNISILEGIKETKYVIGKIVTLLAPQRARVLIFIMISLLASISEGASISLLIPILETMGGGSSLANIPVIGKVTIIFDQYSPSIRLQFLAGAMFVVITARALFLYLASFLAATIPVRMRFELITSLYKDFLATNISYIHNRDAGVLINNIMSQTTRVSTVVGSFTALAVNLLVVSVYVSIMLLISWKLTIASIAFMYALSLAVRRFINPSIRMRGELLTRLTEDAHQLMYESINGFKQIVLSSAQPLMSNKFADIAQSELNARCGQERLQQGIFPVLTIGSGGLICGLIILSSLGYELEISAVIMFTFVLFRLLSPVSTINSLSAAIQCDIHAFSEIDIFHKELLNCRQATGQLPFHGLEDMISFDNVSFNYASTQASVLKNISFSIPKRSMVAIVGPSGAGKSTIINLLAKFYDPSGGHIRIDGIPLNDLDLNMWHKRIGLVSQDITLFNDTIGNNISFAQDDATQENIQAAAKLAEVDEFVQNELPDGYDTSVGDRGVRLSGGQQQRLSLARAVLSKPDLIILDEATSHLDSITEKAIQRTINTLRKTSTILVIAHRLSTIRHADTIVVINKGQVVATGNHDDLVKNNELYKTMVETQQFYSLDKRPKDAAETL
ncbi:MAG: ABC transporter ATP-binding protein [Phycisphaeraceae bacterium]|nr:ABC transporter ATP-binding protein [Phycisphaeraceae bacterium]